MPSDCIFCAIAEGDIPADIVHNDDLVVAFRDIDPKAPRTRPASTRWSSTRTTS